MDPSPLISIKPMEPNLEIELIDGYANLSNDYASEKVFEVSKNTASIFYESA
ncbi:hypothetical protein [Arcticibacterium luteifluviistationis]|uniref:hypothetical protein n=1 Tax=Arcticibacterium luteifluviistationis TaxID=1784714 RepID=UPI0013A6E3E9|nr:hypothetical protein [Arcticibacterium luteifluviistationis]